MHESYGISNTRLIDPVIRTLNHAYRVMHEAYGMRNTHASYVARDTHA